MAQSEKRTLSISAKLNDQLTKPLSTMQARFVAFGRGVANAAKGILSSVFNLKTAVIGLVASFVSLNTVRAFGERADELLKLSQATGDTVENLSDLQATLQFAGLRAEAFGETLKGLQNQTRQALLGNEKMAESFQALGISIEDLATLAPAQLFEKIAAGLGSFSTAQERAVALGRVLPEQFLKLLPALGGGLQKFQAAVREAREVGSTVTQQEARVAESLNTSIAKVQVAIGSLSRALIEEFGPEATALFEKIAKGIAGNKDVFIDLAKVVGTGVVTAVNLAITAVIGLVKTLESIPGVNLLGSVTEQIRVLQQEIDGLKFSGVDQLFPESRERLQVLEKQLDGFRSNQARTLGSVLEETRAKLSQELAAAAAKVRGLAPPVTGDEAYAAVGLPTPSELDVMLQNGLIPGIKKAVDAAKAASGSSIFADPPKGSVGAGLPDASEIKGVSAAVAKLNTDVADLRLTIGEGDFWDAFGKSARENINSWTNWSNAGTEAANSIVSLGLDGVSDTMGAIISKQREASEAWRALGQAAVAELGRIITKLLIIQGLELALGGGVALEKGGVVEGNMGTPKRFASGGVTTGPTLALFGEGRNREAFVPLPDNRTIPVTLTGDTGGTTVNISINAIDSRDVRRMLLEEQDTIAAIFRDQVQSRVGMRQAVQRVRS